MEKREPSVRQIIRESLNSEGSNPGRIKLNPLRWAAMYPVKVFVSYAFSPH